MLLRDAWFENIQVTVKPESREFIRDWFPGCGAHNHAPPAAIAAGTISPEMGCAWRELERRRLHARRRHAQHRRVSCSPAEGEFNELTQRKSRIQRGRVRLRELFQECCEITIGPRGRAIGYERRLDWKPPGGCCS